MTEQLNHWCVKIYNTSFGGLNFVSLKLLLCAVSLHNQHSWIVFTSKLPCQKELSSFSSGSLFGLRSCPLVLFIRNIMMLAITIPETKPCQNPSEGVISCARLLKVVNFWWETQTNCLVTCGWRRIVGVFDMFQRQRLVSKLAYRSEAPRNTAWNYSIVGNSLCFWQTGQEISNSFPGSLFSTSLVSKTTMEAEKRDLGNEVEEISAFLRLFAVFFPCGPWKFIESWWKQKKTASPLLLFACEVWWS